MPLHTLDCAYCGVEFKTYQRAKYCSSSCRWRHHRATAYLLDTNPEMDKNEAAQMAKIKDPAAQARGRSNRARGAQAERDVCHLIRDLTGDDVSRNLTQTRDAGGDVKWGPFYFEVKYQRAIAMPAWQEQAKASAAEDGGGLIPAIVYRRPNDKFWVSLPFETFLMMFDQLRKAAGYGG